MFIAQTAIRYGADAVYIGGKVFSLRSRASNFGLEEIKEIVEFAHKHHKKFMTCNIVFHDEDFDGFIEYIQYLEKVGVGCGHCGIINGYISFKETRT